MLIRKASKRTSLNLAVLFATAIGLFPQIGLLADGQPNQIPCDLAIEDVNLIPMDGDRVLTAQTVLIHAGKISAILNGDKARQMKCGTRIDGSKKYLAPGLVDAHVHLETSAFDVALGFPPAEVDFPALMAPYLANGITGLRVMSGADDILAFRAHANAPESVWPRLVVGSPMLDGNPPILPEPVTSVVETPKAARDAVRTFASQGYDFIKVRANLRPDVFAAVIDEAGKAGLTVDGHIQQANELSVSDILESGQKGFAHVYEFALLMLSRDIDPQRYVDLLRACECHITTTIHLARNSAKTVQDYDALLARPEMQYVNPMFLQAFWLKPNNPYLAESAPAAFFLDLYRMQLVLVKKFNDEGIPVLGGTDALNPMIVPGFSLRDEIASLVEAGLTPYEALATVTVIPARIIPGFRDLGVIAVGRTANLMLLNKNPLQSLDALANIEGVIVNGNWLPASVLRKQLDVLALRYAEMGKAP